MCATSFPATDERTDPRVLEIIAKLKEAYPDATCALHHENPFQLLVATILSAQCTDERVNQVTPRLFSRYAAPRDLMNADPTEVEDIIRSTGFFRNKTKSIRGAAERIETSFGGSVPQTMDDLLTLPGVARKTANVVLGTGYGIAVGVVVDTHVARVSRRLGLTKGGSPAEIERDLMEAVPREDWILFAHLLIFHGRRVCVARNPRCAACPVQALCPSAPMFLSGRVPAWEAARRMGRAHGAARPARGDSSKRARAAKAARVRKRARPVKRTGAAVRAGKRAQAGKGKARPARRRGRR